MPPTSSFPTFASPSPSRVAFVQGLIIAAILITTLYVAREVLVPLALATLLSFVLTPPLLFLRRLGIPKVLGVATLVSVASGCGCSQTCPTARTRGRRLTLGQAK